MIDIVRAFQTIVDQDHPLDHLDQIVLAQRPVLARHNRVQSQSLIQLVATDTFQVIAPLIVQLPLQKLPRVVQRRRIAGPHPAIELDQRLLRHRVPALWLPDRLLAQRRRNIQAILVRIDVLKERQDLLVRSFHQRRVPQSVIDRRQGAQQDRHRDRSFAVKLDRQIIRLPRLELHPGPPIGDQLARGQRPAGSPVLLHVEIHAGRADQLAHHHPLRPIDHKRAALRHQGEITQEKLLHDDLARLRVPQRHLGIQGHRVGHIPFQAFLFVVFRLGEPVGQAQLLRLLASPGKIELQIPLETIDRRDLIKQVQQALALELGERVKLYFDQRRQRVRLGHPRIGLGPTIFSHPPAPPRSESLLGKHSRGAQHTDVRPLSRQYSCEICDPEL